MAGNNKLKDKKAAEQQRKSPDHGSAGDFHKTKPANGKRKNKAKVQKSTGWSLLGKLNLLLLVVVAALAGRVLYLHSADGTDMDGAQARLLASWRLLAAAGSQYGGALLDQARLGYDWLAGHAAGLDARLTKSQPDLYVPVKAAAGRAAGAASHYGAVAGERALVLGTQAAQLSARTAQAGWRLARPYVNATLAAARPYWDAAAARAGPLWTAAVHRGHAVKAGVLEQAARLRAEAAPLLQRWSRSAQLTLGSTWAVVQAEAPVYAGLAWNATCKAGAAAWHAAQTGWQVVRTEVPVYADKAGQWVTKTVASLTGDKPK